MCGRIDETDELNAGTSHVVLVNLSASKLKFETFHIYARHEIEILIALGGIGAVGIGRGGTGGKGEGLVEAT